METDKFKNYTTQYFYTTTGSTRDDGASIPMSQAIIDDDSSEGEPQPVLITTPEEREGTIPGSVTADMIAYSTRLAQANPTSQRIQRKKKKRRKSKKKRQNFKKSQNSPTATVSKTSAPSHEDPAAEPCYQTKYCKFVDL